MTEIDDGGPAFPVPTHSQQNGGATHWSWGGGMTLRQWLAGQVVVGLVANSANGTPPGIKKEELPGIVARAAVLVADALIAELKGGGE